MSIQTTQCVLVPRKVGELELDFENPTWKSIWDLKEFTVKFSVGFTTNFAIYDFTPKI